MSFTWFLCSKYLIPTLSLVRELIPHGSPADSQKENVKKKDVFLLNHHESQQYVHSSILTIKNHHLQSIQLSLITKKW